MSNSCVYCSKLTIESLVALTRQKPKRGQASYKHHDSFSDLEAAALDGCDLCRLALETFQRQNLCEEARNLERSNVKVWIDLEHGDADFLNPPEVLDAIVFMVGETSIKALDGFKEVRIRLIAKEDCIPHLRPYSLNYTIENQVLGSASNFARVNQWLYDCEKYHVGCWPSETPMLPTRVIDVGTLPADAQNDKVRIFCSQGIRARYVALSHCWGGKIEPRLKLSNLDKFQSSILCSSLPATFRDAITITRNLGFQYLWIDSLCIVQDSPNLEQELDNMGPVYRDSTLGLFAAASKNSNEGILNKEPSISYPKDAQLKVFSDPADSTTVMASVRCFSPGESSKQVWLQSPLASRGWTFQEQALAPRCLIYGEKGIYWRCPQNIRSSKLSHVDVLDKLLRTTKTIEPILHSPTLPCDSRISVDLFDLMIDYYDLVSRYSERNLKSPSDKLPAMSTIAKALSHKLAQENASPTYLAGLWEMDLPRGLMWKALSKSHAPHVSIYRAPSWSWATTDSPITFVGMLKSGWDREWHTDLRVVSCEVCPLRPGNPFSEVKSGRLVVEGRMIPLKRSRQVLQTNGFIFGSIGRCKYDECLDGENPGLSASSIIQITNGQQSALLTLVENARAPGGSNTRKSDELEIDEASFREEHYKAVIISIADIDPREPREEKLARGILVQRCSGSEDYKRIGCLIDLEITCTWLDSIQGERLVIV
ncbi:HET domain-containing protein [Fusarium sp. LHS14.1]|nr:HET domain-containing protein [Fusarium sp. LHS14.1]